MAEFVPLHGFPNFTREQQKSRAAEFLHMISARRTVRMFDSEDFGEETLLHCVQSACTAPSGANKQPWHFVIVKDAKTKKEIRLAAEKEEHAFYGGKAGKQWLADLEQFGTNEQKPFLETAPYLIVVFAESYAEAGEEKKKNYYVAESVGIACGFLLAALQYAGIATLTHTPSPMNFLNGILKRGKNERPYLIIVAGLPASDVMVPNISKKTVSDVITII